MRIPGIQLIEAVVWIATNDEDASLDAGEATGLATVAMASSMWGRPQRDIGEMVISVRKVLKELGDEAGMPLAIRMLREGKWERCNGCGGDRTVPCLACNGDRPRSCDECTRGRVPCEVCSAG